MRPRHLSIALAVWLAACASLYARDAKAQTLTAEQARDHVGETANVCGRVASVHYADKIRGRPTFLNLGRPYPHEIFTAVIWGTDRAKFGEPEKLYHHRRICVKGFISVYRSQPDMTVRTPSQITAK